LISIGFAALAALFGGIAKQLIPYLRALAVTASDQWLVGLVTSAVWAAEQLWAHTTGAGKEKVRYVFERLDARGIDIADKESHILELIESAVLEMKTAIM